jgi:hypothetical protein
MRNCSHADVLSGLFLAVWACFSGGNWWNLAIAISWPTHRAAVYPPIGGLLTRLMVPIEEHILRSMQRLWIFEGGDAKPPLRAQATPAQNSASPSAVFAFEWQNLSFRSDWIFVLAIAICLAVGIAIGRPAAGMIAAGGAFTIGFGAKQSIDDSPLLPMIFAALGISFSTFIGMIAGHTNFVLVPIVALWGFGDGMLSSRAPGFSWVGQQCVVFLLVSSAFPFSPRAAAVRAALVLAGSAVQILCSSLLLHMLHQLHDNLLAIARYVREEQALLRSTMVEAAQSLRAGQVTHSALPYAFRVAMTLGVSTEIYRRLHYASGYWIPMTALLVLKPGLADTAARAIARTVGTLAGAILCSIFLVHLPITPGALAVSALLFAWLSYATVNVNYGLFSVCITAYIVFLLSLNGGPGKEVAEHRAIATAIGGGLALAVSLVVIRIRFLKTRKQKAAAGLSQA